MLAQEIVDEIIGHLHDSPQNLRACSLTSKSWLPASRHFLHSNFTYTNKEDENKTVFYADHEQLARCVRRLTLNLKDRGHRPSIVNDLFDLQVLFPQLDTLEIRGGFSWTENDTKFKLYIRDKVPCHKIRSLRLYGVVFVTLPLFLEFLTLFPTLSSIVLRDVSITESSDAGSDDNKEILGTAAPFTLDLQSLQVDSTILFSSPIVQWLRAANVNILAENLTINLVNPRHPGRVYSSEKIDTRGFMDRCSSSIKHLRIQQTNHAKFFPSKSCIMRHSWLKN